MMKARYSSETSVLTRATQRNIPEENFLRSHCRENLKVYKRNTSEALMSLEEENVSQIILTNIKQTPWPLVRERTIPTERPPLVDEI
jgi:hypothetical protein